MKIETRKVGDVTVLDCSGKITLGEGTMAVRNSVREILKNGGMKIILNLGDVNYIDSSGIGELVSSYTTVTNGGGQLKLLNLTKKIQELLAITKLLTVFQVYNDERAAVASFSWRNSLSKFTSLDRSLKSATPISRIRHANA